MNIWEGFVGMGGMVALSYRKKSRYENFIRWEFFWIK